MTGTALAFIFVCITVPVATVGAIWLEQRMPPLPQPRSTTAHDLPARGRYHR